MLRGIVDTGFLVGFLNRNNLPHRWAVELAGQVEEPLLTCEAVIVEAAFHIRDTGKVLALIDDGLIRLAFRAGEHQQQLTMLAQRYRDRRPDFADLCLVRMSELYPTHSVLTVDTKDFRVYRRFDRALIPVVTPEI